MEPTSPTPEEVQPIVVLHNPGFKDQLPFKKILLITLAIILILASIAVALFMVSKNSLKLPTSTPTPVPTPSQSKLPPTTVPEIGAKTLILKDCNINPASNPLVSRVIPASKDTPAIIILLGNANNIFFTTFNQGRKTANISLLSFRSEQIHQVTVDQAKGLVFDQTLGREASVSDLKIGQLLEIQYNCFPQNPADQRFKLAQIYIR